MSTLPSVSNMTEDFPLTTQPTVPSSVVRKMVGVIICIIGNVLISIAMNMQKWVHRNLEGTNKDYCKSFLWWVALAIIGIGELGNFGAYGFAPASVVAPLGSVGVISNAFIAVIFMKEKIRLRDVVGVVWAVVGAYLIISFSAGEQQLFVAERIINYLEQYPLIVLILTEVVLFIGLMFIHKKEERINPITMCLQVALLGSPTVIAAKAVSSMIATSVWYNAQYNQPIFWIMVVIMIFSIIGQIRYLNAALKRYDSSVVMPIYFVFFTIVAITSGVVFYKELWHLQALQVSMSLLGAALSFGGVYLISAGREEEKEGKAERKREEEEGLLEEEEVLLEEEAAREDGKDVGEHRGSVASGDYLQLKAGNS